MTNYFRKFIKRYAQVVHPMTDLLKSNIAFRWSTACQDAFDKVKELLTTAPDCVDATRLAQPGTV